MTTKQPQRRMTLEPVTSHGCCTIPWQVARQDELEIFLVMMSCPAYSSRQSRASSSLESFKLQSNLQILGGPARQIRGPASGRPTFGTGPCTMARNEEKAMSMLARWLRVQSGADEKKQERRPHLASLCETLPECEKWRQQILRDITKKVNVKEYDFAISCP